MVDEDDDFMICCCFCCATKSPAPAKTPAVLNFVAQGACSRHVWYMVAADESPSIGSMKSASSRVGDDDLDVDLQEAADGAGTTRGSRGVGVQEEQGEETMNPVALGLLTHRAAAATWT